MSFHSGIPGLLESTYEACFCDERELSGLQLQRQIPIPVIDLDLKLDSGYRIDILVIQVKSVATLLSVHEARLLTCLKYIGGGRG